MTALTLDFGAVMAAAGACGLTTVSGDCRLARLRAWDCRRALVCGAWARGGPNHANQCKRLRASRARCRPHSSRVAALVMRRARRPCSAYMGGVCNRQGYCPCCGADAAAHQQQCDEQCSDHYFCTAGAWMARSAGKIWALCTCTCLSTFSATARNDHWADRSIVWVPTTVITGAFRECSGVLVPYRTLAFLRSNAVFFAPNSLRSRKQPLCAWNPPRVLLSTSSSKKNAASYA